MADSEVRALDDPEVVERALDAIRAFYLRGQESLQKCSARGRKPRDADGAPRRGPYTEAMRKARQFARAYTPEELFELCVACREARFAIGATHLIRLLTASTKEERAAKQEQVIRERWSVSRLEREVRKSRSIKDRTHRERSGRGRVVPADKLELLTQLETMVRSWGRWHAAANRAVGEGPGTILSGAGLPGAVTDAITGVSEAFIRLKQLVRDEIECEVKGQDAGRRDGEDPGAVQSVAAGHAEAQGPLEELVRQALGELRKILLERGVPGPAEPVAEPEEGRGPSPGITSRHDRTGHVD